MQGPIFANILLADEINRTPPKTQSALLEAMQERSCTVRGNTIRCPAPFFVLATQNPIELEGTYPLPEAQLDRFLFNTVLDYLTRGRGTEGGRPDHDDARRPGRAGDHRRRDPGVPATGAHGADRRIGGALRGRTGARHARPSTRRAPDFVKKYVNYGASVRAAQFLVLAAKARALMKDRYHVTYEDIRSLLHPGAAASHSAELPRGIRPAEAGRHPEEILEVEACSEEA